MELPRRTYRVLNKELLDAIVLQDVPRMQRAIESGASVNARYATDPHRRRALDFARQTAWDSPLAEWQRANAIRSLLVDNGALPRRQLAEARHETMLSRSWEIVPLEAEPELSPVGALGRARRVRFGEARTGWTRQPELSAAEAADPDMPPVVQWPVTAASASAANPPPERISAAAAMSPVAGAQRHSATATAPAGIPHRSAPSDPAAGHTPEPS